MYIISYPSMGMNDALPSPCHHMDLYMPQSLLGRYLECENMQVNDTESREGFISRTMNLPKFRSRDYEAPSISPQLCSCLSPARQAYSRVPSKSEEHAPRLHQKAPHMAAPALYEPASECPCSREHLAHCPTLRNWRTLSVT